MQILVNNIDFILYEFYKIIILKNFWVKKIKIYVWLEINFDFNEKLFKKRKQKNWIFNF